MTKDPRRERTAVFYLTEDSVSSSLSRSIGKKSKLHQFGAREVADELSLMDSELLRKIRPEELEGCAWTKHDKYTRASNIMAMVRASNDLALLVPTEVLSEESPSAMARCISAFIKIASKCYRQNNLNSLKAILAGLQCTPIYRLKQTWKEVPSKRRKRFDVLTKLMSEEYNWRSYHRYLHSLLESTTPCIPFLGVLLTATVQYDSAMSECGRTRRVSGVEDYTILEAITVRNKLETIRHLSTGWRRSLPPWLEEPHHPVDSTVTPILEVPDATPTILGNDSCDSDHSSDSDGDSGAPPPEIPPLVRARQRRVWSEAGPDSEEVLSELTLSRSFDGLKDAFSNWEVLESSSMLNSVESVYTSSASSTESSSSLPIANGNRPHPTPPPLSPEPVTPSEQTHGEFSFISGERRSRASCISIPDSKMLLFAPVSRKVSPPITRISQCSVDIPPEVLTQRRRPSTLLGVLHASNTPTEQLARFQLMSLGCSAGIHGNPELRAVITGKRNTEGTNYRLSYLREPG